MPISHQIYIVIFVFAGLILTLPLETLQVLMWIAIHLFELLEFILDDAIHHVFHTSRHVTQVIVFYLMAELFLYSFHRVVKSVKGIYRKEPVMISGESAKPKTAFFFNRLFLNKRAQLIFGCTFLALHFCPWRSFNRSR
ncbi:MAG: hypothetical protein PHG00_00140 [Methylococcales bacterium]|nr:hypothetical protein [Methylococcales bacterium]